MIRSNQLNLCQAHMVDEFVNQITSLKGTLYVAGNGGSASIANHMACDFMNVGIPTVSLSANSPLLTMIANDYGYEDVFEYQLLRLYRPNDMVLLVSSSGNSKNIVKAAYLALERELTLLSFTGFDGGKLKELSDINYHVESNDYGHVETEHTRFFHHVTNTIKGKS